MTRALVLGHSGFIGKELWRALSELDYSLVGVNSNLVRFSSKGESRERNYSHEAEMLSMLEHLEFDYIFLSANYFSRVSSPSPREMVMIDKANVVLPLEIVRHALNKKTIVCNLGSFWALPGHEKQSLPYSQSKVTLVNELKGLVGSSRLLNLYLTDTFGQGDRRGKVIQKMMEAMTSKSSFELHSPSTIISFSHVEDLVATILDCIEKKRIGDFLVVGSHNLELRELLKAAEKKSHETSTGSEFLRQSNLTLDPQIQILKIASARELISSLDEIESDIGAQSQIQSSSGPTRPHSGG